VIATEKIDPRINEGAGRRSPARPLLTLAAVEGRRLVRHPALVVIVGLAMGQGVQFVLRAGPDSERNVGWLLQVGAMFVSLAALLAANLQALKSRRDGSEELFRTAPLSPASRTLALGLSAILVAVGLGVTLLVGDLAIRTAGHAANNESGHALFPLFDLVQGPLMVGLFVLIGIAVARWLPWSHAGPVAVAAMFVLSTSILNPPGEPPWMRLTPFDQTFVSDGAVLVALHVAYLVGLMTVVLVIAIMRFGRTPMIRAWLGGGLGLCVLTGFLQVAA
jgi:hypothetical protein